jgi:hypothetical protein
MTLRELDADCYGSKTHGNQVSGFRLFIRSIAAGQ